MWVGKLALGIIRHLGIVWEQSAMALWRVFARKEEGQVSD